MADKKKNPPSIDEATRQLAEAEVELDKAQADAERAADTLADAEVRVQVRKRALRDANRVATDAAKKEGGVRPVM